MAENNFGNVMDSLMKNMDHLIGSKTVVGEAATIGDAIIVPLVDVSFGVGAGASTNDKKNGGAGGMSAKLSPSAVLVIQNGNAKLVSVKNQDTLTKIVDLIPEVIDKIKAKKEGMIDNDEAISEAFPDKESSKTEE
ncbi:MAG: GerW family sporulation protein [Lachnospiraceae bacterium]